LQPGRTDRTRHRLGHALPARLRVAVLPGPGARGKGTAQRDDGLTLMGRYVFKLADVGEGMAEAEITHWHVAAGDSIEEDQPLVDVSTDKTVVEIPAPVSGKVISIHGALGEKVAVGSELAVIETETEGSTVTATPSVAITPTTASTASKSGAQAAPAVRGRARKLGVDLQLVKGTGP